MVIEVERPAVRFTVRRRRFVQSDEVVVFCPACKTLETLAYTDGQLSKTRKFVQQDSAIFHDCGTVKPCLLFRPI